MNCILNIDNTRFLSPTQRNGCKLWNRFQSFAPQKLPPAKESSANFIFVLALCLSRHIFAAECGYFVRRGSLLIRLPGASANVEISVFSQFLRVEKWREFVNS